MVAQKLKKLLLIGNPNVGKSVLFGQLTGKYVTVSNYPGTSVEVTYGNASIKGEQFTVVDTPGINSLLPMSEDEVVTRDMLLTEDFDHVLQVADTKNLRRSLVISLQLAEMGVPFSMALNMADEAEDAGIETDFAALGRLTGVETVSTVATRRKGMGKLREVVTKTRPSCLNIEYDDRVEMGVARISNLLPDSRISRRSIALMLLGGDTSLRGWLHSVVSDEAIEAIEAIVKEAQSASQEPLGYVINRVRLAAVDKVVSACQRKVASHGTGWRRRLGDATMHPLLGLPVLAFVLYAMYQFVGVFGAGYLVDMMEEQVFGGFINPLTTRFFDAVLPVEFLRELFVGEYGIVTVALTYAIAIVLPITMTFFIAFGILEDSGYLPRLSIMLNRMFKTIGLNGKAVLPMVLGLGCATMATLTTRILETKRERMIVTLLLALAIPCSAQLGVIMGMLAGISPVGTFIWGGTVLAVLLSVGFAISRILKGDPPDFIMEIPPIRMPRIKNIVLKTFGRIEWYLKEAVPLFILGTLVLYAADKTHLLGLIERVASPVVVGMLDLPPRATQAFIIGFLRRDYGAAGLFAMSREGLLTPVQVVVSLVTITLFVPCVAQFFVTIKERGMKFAALTVLFVFPFAVLVGAALNMTLKVLGVTLQ
ncbi:MAG: ferrous iron transport protein B [Nitrospirae bacterium]|nr:ferrous iron transport protein B [Nitrospirota bacterium]